MIPARAFYMIRHGESTANLAQIVSGHRDVALTPRGIEQARAAARIVAGLQEKPSLILHSNLSRARDTAVILNEVLNIPMEEDPLLAEQFYGDWEGGSWDLYRQPIRDGMDPPGGETMVQFQNRIKEAIARHLPRHPGRIMIVCHGGVFRAFGALYGEKIVGTENCVLHRFDPHPVNEAFPWNVQRF
jgi:2,3-bisphosphoglycerate-dependent phosphoglycerate mutase